MQKPLEILWNLDPKSKVFAPKSRVFALLGAKALDFGAKALEFFDLFIKNLVEFQVGQVLSSIGAVPLETYELSKRRSLSGQRYRHVSKYLGRQRGGSGGAAQIHAR